MTIIRDSWAIMSANALLAASALVFGWSLDLFIIVLWVEVVALAVLGMPLFFLISRKSNREVIGFLLLHIVFCVSLWIHFYMGLGVSLISKYADAPITSHADMWNIAVLSGTLPTSSVAIFALVVLNEVLSGLALRRRELSLDTDTTSDSFKNGPCKIIFEGLPVAIGLIIGLKIVGGDSSPQKAILIVVTAKTASTFFLMSLTWDQEYISAPPPKKTGPTQPPLTQRELDSLPRRHAMPAPATHRGNLRRSR